MPWFKVDDNLAFHHKVVAAGNPAIGMWVRAGALCAQQLTDGFIPEHMIGAIGTKAQAEKLVSVGLWDLAQGGYRFHEWSERQPSKASVEAERAASADRMREYRARRKGTAQEVSPQVSDESDAPVTENEQRSFGRSSENVRQPRPSPSPDPVPTQSHKESGGGKRAVQRPADFKPTQAHIELATERGIDLRNEWAKFCDWSDANGKTYKDWSAALRNWIRNARPTTQALGQPSRVQQHLALAQQLAAEDSSHLEIGDGR
jgi:hypothetical protein